MYNIKVSIFSSKAPNAKKNLVWNLWVFAHCCVKDKSLIQRTFPNEVSIKIISLRIQGNNYFLMEVHRSFQQFLASAVERTHHSHKHMARNSRQRGNVESVTVSLVFGHNRESLVLVRTVFWPALNKSPGFLWSQQHEWRSASVPLKPFKCGGGPLLVIFGLKTFLGIFHHLSNSLGGQKIKTLTALLSNPPGAFNWARTHCTACNWKESTSETGKVQESYDDLHPVKEDVALLKRNKTQNKHFDFILTM